jgi:hypothetical protein
MVVVWGTQSIVGRFGQCFHMFTNGLTDIAPGIQENLETLCSRNNEEPIARNLLSRWYLSYFCVVHETQQDGTTWVK